MPKRFDNARALQQNAVKLALKAFGVVDGAASLALRGDTTLGTIRLQEDAVIEHDARWIAGWRLEASDLTGRAVFVRGDGQLELFTANKLPLEKLFGVDLIYLNQTRGAVVMVQYKMMETEERKGRRFNTRLFTNSEAEEPEWTVPINRQFRTEIDRMISFDKDLSPEGSYRLNSGAFFFKLVKRHAATSTSGIMLSLGHLIQLIADGGTTGPKGGLRISYRALNGHYLRSDSFIELLQSGYIGTRGATTEHLQELIEATLKGGRAVVAAIQSVMERI